VLYYEVTGAPRTIVLARRDGTVIGHIVVPVGQSILVFAYANSMEASLNPERFLHGSFAPSNSLVHILRVDILLPPTLLEFTNDHANALIDVLWDTEPTGYEVPEVSAVNVPGSHGLRQSQGK
jgi:hypothetical protein